MYSVDLATARAGFIRTRASRDSLNRFPKTNFDIEFNERFFGNGRHSLESLRVVSNHDGDFGRIEWDLYHLLTEPLTGIEPRYLILLHDDEMDSLGLFETGAGYSSGRSSPNGYAEMRCQLQ